MSNLKFFHGLLNSLFEKPKNKSKFSFFSENKAPLSSKEFIDNVATAMGEVSALGHAEMLMQHCENLNDDELLNFFKLLSTSYNFSHDDLSQKLKNYNEIKNSENLINFLKFVEPQRREIFRRCNAISRGTIRLVKLRSKLLRLIKKNSDLHAVDFDLVYLFKNWFNRGFLILRPINWETPAHILEKIIAYEAVHEINSWDELRSRLAPKDRRCFAFFHPAMQDEPIIFVEVALMKDVPSKIESVLREKRDILEPEDTNTAVFYSISNCQKGLAGISFGNFLIKQVANDLNLEFNNLKKFITLSPVPGLRKWLKNKFPQFDLRLDKCQKTEHYLKLHDDLMDYAGQYFTNSDRPDKMPNDPVARFHLGNGASLEQINFLADTSANGISLSGGLMVNYLYDLEKVEQNHELMVSDKKINISKSAKKDLLKYMKSSKLQAL